MWISSWLAIPFVLCVGGGVGLLLGFMAGFWLCGYDAEQRLTGKKPVDAYWRAKGMK